MQFFPWIFLFLYAFRLLLIMYNFVKQLSTSSLVIISTSILDWKKKEFPLESLIGRVTKMMFYE